MADIEEFVVVETPPELKRKDETGGSPSPVVIDTIDDAKKDSSPDPEPSTPEPSTPEPTTVTDTKKDDEPEPAKDEMKDTPSENEITKEPTTTDTTATAMEEPTKTEEPKDELKSEEPKLEEPKVEEPKVEEPKVDDPKVEDPKVEEPKVEEPISSEHQQYTVAISGKHIKQMLSGTELVKVRKGSKLYPRQFYVTGDLLRIVWISKRKPVSKSQIALSQILDVIKGRQTESFKQFHSSVEEEKCFSIIYHDSGAHVTLDLIAHSAEDADIWTRGLQALIGNGVSENTAEVRKKWLRSIFDEADVNGDGTLDLKEVIRMLKRLNLGIQQKKLKKMFKEADSEGNSDNKLDFDEFCKLFAIFSERPELRVLFNLYATSNDGSYMTVEDVLNFIQTEQENDDATIDYCSSIIERFEPSDASQRNLLSLDGFTHFIMSGENDLFKREHKQVYQDMTQPLAHYFIASSHNTYLLEDQLSGPSSVNAYIRALKRGCRCVELDCWDGEDNEPIVYHGHTLTSKILFKDCIQAIKDNAFVTSVYPVILSIENHCSVAQQHVLAEHLIDILGDLLYKQTRNEQLGKLPSPEDLKNKILIKAKKLPKEHEDKDDDDGEVSDEDEGAEVDKEDVKKAKKEPTPVDSPDDIPDGPETEVREASPEVRKVVRDRSDTNTKANEDVQKPSAKRKLSSKLSKCVNYVQSVHFKGFEESINAPFYHMSSFGESSAFKHSENKAANYIEYNKTHLSRTYPAGRRVDSSNYEPIDLWNCGCQIVALNYQTPGKPMDLNIGKFQQNGGCGYILKPEIMREDYTHFNHKDINGAHGITPKVVSVRVISGERLPKPEGGSKDGEIIDPYVIVRFNGMSVDKNFHKTKYVEDNGFNPIWNETFKQLVTFPELAIVQFAIYDYDVLSKDDFIGQFTLPLTSMNTGYHSVQLHTTEWEPIEGAKLFVEIRVHDWVGPTPKSKEKLRFTMGKKTRQYPLIKLVSFPALDSVFRNLKTTVQLSTNIREDFQYQLMLFKEACGKSSIPDCLEAISLKSHADRIQLKLVAIETTTTPVYQLEVAGDNTTTHQTGVTGSLIKIIASFNKLNGLINSLLNVAEQTSSELDDHCQQALKEKEEFFKSISKLSPQKATQLKYIYSHNVSTAKNEASELHQVYTSAKQLLEKIPKSAEKFGILPAKPVNVATPTTNDVTNADAPTKGEEPTGDTPTKGEEPKGDTPTKEEEPIESTAF